MIPMARLRKLESAANVCISADEAEVLAGVLGCSTEELTADQEYDAPASGPLEAAEGGKVVVPRMELAALAGYDAGESIGNFAYGSARYFTECEAFLDAAAVVDAPSEELCAAIPGRFSLTLSEPRRDGGDAALELCMNAEGEFFVRGGCAGVFDVPGGGDRAVWAVPILKICYFPEN